MSPYTSFPSMVKFSFLAYTLEQYYPGRCSDWAVGVATNESWLESRTRKQIFILNL